MTLALEVSGVKAWYGDFQALFGIDLIVGEGEVVALVGSNGSGKSTFLRTLCKLHDSRWGRQHVSARKFDGNVWMC